MVTFSLRAMFSEFLPQYCCFVRKQKRSPLFTGIRREGEGKKTWDYLTGGTEEQTRNSISIIRAKDLEGGGRNVGRD